MPKVTFASQTRTALPGSHRPPLEDVGGRKPLRSSQRVTVSVIVRPKTPLRANALGEQRLTRTAFRANHAADPGAVKAVRAFATEFHLTAEAHAERRTLLLTGTVADMERAFGVKLTMSALRGADYRTREGDILLPESLAGMVEAVLGLDNRPQASPQFRMAEKPSKGAVLPHAAGTSFTPPQVAQLYGLPAGSTASGQTIGIIELGGGFKTADIKAYFKALALPTPTVVAVSVDGGKNKSDGPNGADGEVMLDIEVAGAVAPGAKLAVYFAPNTDQGFVDAISTAVHDAVNKPSIISISWGGPESTWTVQARNALDQACQSAAALGITVLAASGDNGSSDGVSDGKPHVDFPASSPHVLACGGTKLTAANGSIQSEVVWNETSTNEGATGGGISDVFPQPAWQSAVASTKGGRGVPDVSGNADPTTGYQIRVDGQNAVIGGTSAVSPLWAGLLAVINARAKTSVGFIQPKLYAAGARSGFRDITQGNNGTFQAGRGWDACTGLGSPNVANLLTLLVPKSKASAKRAAAVSKD